VTWLYGLQSFRGQAGALRIPRAPGIDGAAQDAFPSILVGGTTGRDRSRRCWTDAARPRTQHGGSTPRRHLVGRTRGSGSADATSATASSTPCSTACAGRCERGLADGTLEAHPSFFEVMTAAALTAFRDARIDTAGAEVGLGGRLDATNARSRVVSAIVTVDLDHTATLGGTLAAMPARRRDRPAGGSGFRRHPTELCGPSARAAPRDGELPPTRVAAVGIEARRGERSRFAPQRELRRSPPAAGRSPPERQREGRGRDPRGVRRGDGSHRPSGCNTFRARRARWPGRLQLLPGRPPILLDGPTTRKERGSRAHPRRTDREGAPRPVLLFGAMKDKDVPRIVGPIARFVESRGRRDPSRDRGMGLGGAGCSTSRRGAFRRSRGDPRRRARTRAKPRGAGTGMVLVAGSLYLVGAVLALIEGAMRRGRSRCNNAEPMPTKIASASSRCASIPTRRSSDSTDRRIRPDRALEVEIGIGKDDPPGRRGAPPGGAPLRNRVVERVPAHRPNRAPSGRV